MQTHHVLFVFLILLLLLCGCTTDKSALSPDADKTGALDPLTTLNNSLVEEPENPDLWYAVAEILYEKGDIKGALDAITRAAEFSPGNSTILLTKAQMLITAGERDRANRELLKVLDLLPGNKTALDLLSS